MTLLCLVLLTIPSLRPINHIIDNAALRFSGKVEALVELPLTANV